MGATYRIELSKNGPGESKDVLGTGKSLREIELVMLKNLFEVAANNQKKIKDANLAIDCVEQIENLADDPEFIDFHPKDIELLRSGWEKTEGSRPSVWFKCRSLLKQIEAPSELKGRND